MGAWTYNESDLLKLKSLNACEDCDLRGANISKDRLLDPSLYFAILKAANLKRANLSKAYLKRANLSEANLSEANLTGANLTGANLKGANLKEANLSEANLTGANTKNVRLDGAKYCKTKMPWGELNDGCP